MNCEEKFSLHVVFISFLLLHTIVMLQKVLTHGSIYMVFFSALCHTSCLIFKVVVQLHSSAKLCTKCLKVVLKVIFVLLKKKILTF